MSLIPVQRTAFIEPGYAAYRCPVGGVAHPRDLMRGFTIDPDSIIEPVADTDKSLQVQELCCHVDPSNPTLLEGYYSGWSTAEATTSGLWRTSATVADPTTWTGDTQLTVSGGSETYIRLQGVVWDGSTRYFYLGGTNLPTSIYTSSNGTTLTYQGVALTTAGNGVVDTGLPTLTAVLKVGNTWYMVYCVGPAAVGSAYRLATSSDGLTWTKLGITIFTDANLSGAVLEWHCLKKINNWFVLLMEAYDGTHWNTYMAYASVFTGPWTVAGIVMTRDVSSSFAQEHVATPFLVQVGNSWHVFFQGSNTAGTGGGGAWALGHAAYNVP